MCDEQLRHWQASWSKKPFVVCHENLLTRTGRSGDAWDKQLKSLLRQQSCSGPIKCHHTCVKWVSNNWWLHWLYWCFVILTSHVGITEHRRNTEITTVPAVLVVGCWDVHMQRHHYWHCWLTLYANAMTAAIVTMYNVINSGSSRVFLEFDVHNYSTCFCAFVCVHKVVFLSCSSLAIQSILQQIFTSSTINAVSIAAVKQAVEV